MSQQQPPLQPRSEISTDVASAAPREVLETCSGSTMALPEKTVAFELSHAEVLARCPVLNCFRVGKSRPPGSPTSQAEVFLTHLGLLPQRQDEKMEFQGQRSTESEEDAP
jgi:hypothetical protein